MSWFDSTTEKVQKEAGDILEQGKLLEATGRVAYVENHNDDWSMRCARALSLVLAGQMLRRAKDNTRLYSHLGLYQPKGMGRGNFLSWMEENKVVPQYAYDEVGGTTNHGFRIAELDASTDAALMSSVTAEGNIKPSILVKSDVVKVEEFATLLSRKDQDIMAYIRKLQEAGKFTRDLVQFKKFSEILREGDFAEKRLAEGKLKNEKIILDLAAKADRGNRLREDIEKWHKGGLIIDVSDGRMVTHSHASWIISSARFGDTVKRKPLLELGDLDRYVWISNIPDIDERRVAIHKVALRSPPEPCEYAPEAVGRAWKLLYLSMQRFRGDRAIEIPATPADHEARVKYWDEVDKAIPIEYKDMVTEKHQEEILTFRYVTEFIRTAYQHATLMQFNRNHDFQSPNTPFVLNYEEDFGFARDMWLTEFVPSFIEIINDVKGLWAGFVEAEKKTREERIKKEEQMLLIAFKSLGSTDVLATDLHQAIKKLGGPESYVGIWKFLERGTKRGIVEFIHAVGGQHARVTLTKEGEERLGK